MKNNPIGHFSSLTRKLIIGIVAFSALITFVTTGFQLYGNYQRDVIDIESRFQQIEHVHLDGIVRQVWIADEKDIMHEIQVIIKLPDISHIQIVEPDGNRIEVGVVQSEKVLEKTFPLTYTYRDNLVPLGELRVQATLKEIYQKLYDQVWVILVSNAVKTFLVSGFIILFVHLLLHRHLHRIAEHAHELSVESLSEKIELDRKKSNLANEDELDYLVNSINRMQDNIHRSVKEIRDKDNTIHLLLDTTASAIFGIDHAGKCTFANRACFSSLGYESEKDLLGVEMHEKINALNEEGAALELDKRIFVKTINSQKPIHRNDEIFWKANGGAMNVECWCYPMFKEAEFTGAVVSFVDITRRRKVEKELEEYKLHLEELVDKRTKKLKMVNTELESFCYSVSHDLRSPLRAINGFSQILVQDMDVMKEEDRLDYLDRIASAADNMGLLIESLLELSRITRQKKLKLEFVNVSKLAKDILEKLIHADGLDNVNYSIEENLICKGDENLVVIVLNNLLENAIKYSAKKATIEINVGQKKINDTTVFFVTDNGAGFEQEYVNKIFEPFQRLHQEKDYSGMGIGLATVRRIVDRHGGSIWAEGVADSGATFYFTFENKEILEQGDNSDIKLLSQA